MPQGGQGEILVTFPLPVQKCVFCANERTFGLVCKYSRS